MNFGKIKKYYSIYYPVSLYFLAIIIIFPLYPIIRHYLVATNTSLIYEYAKILYWSTVRIMYFFSLDYRMIDLAIHKGLRFDTTIMALWQTMLIVGACVFLERKYITRIILLFSGIIFIFLFNVGRIILLSLSYIRAIEFPSSVVNGILVMLLNFICVGIGYYWLKNNFPLKRFLISKLKFNKKTYKHILRNTVIALSIIILTNFLAYTQLLPIVSFLSTVILKSSQFFLHLLGYVSEVKDRFIFQKDGISIFMSDSCIGLELMLIFGSFIAIVGGKLINKIWFIGIGIIIIYILNVLRISLIFIYLIHNNGKYSLAINIHDLFTYTVYLVTFVMWVIWINKFSERKDLK